MDKKSKSSYVSTIVGVRSLHLCCDYRTLSSKIIPGRHPIPCVQDLLDKLFGKKWFPVLDQKKVYQQI